MTEFDELLKQKVEQTDYPYRHAAWRQFLRGSGLHTALSGVQIAALSLAGVAVIALVTWGIIRHAAPASSPLEPVPTEIAATTADSSEYDIPDTINQTPCNPSGEGNSQVTGTTRKKATHDVPANAEPTALPAKLQPVTQPSTPKTRERLYGRPVTISVDTITQMQPSEEQLKSRNSQIIVE
ncbi:MAG: hypothetical protein J5730_08035 [Bacteroidales bacterium]|nr:hypothetical protein [Bacteroidales bacterium]